MFDHDIKTFKVIKSSRGFAPRASYAFSHFDIMVKHSGAFLIYNVKHGSVYERIHLCRLLLNKNQERHNDKNIAKEKRKEEKSPSFSDSESSVEEIEQHDEEENEYNEQLEEMNKMNQMRNL